MYLYIYDLLVFIHTVTNLILINAYEKLKILKHLLKKIFEFL